MTLPRRVLIMTDHLDLGCGTLTFLLQLLAIHRRQGIETTVAVESQLATEDLVACIATQDGQIFRVPDRPRLFRRSYLALGWDYYVCRRALRIVRPDFLMASTRSINLLLGGFAFSLPFVYVVHSYPVLSLRPGLCRILRLLRKPWQTFLTVSQFSARRLCDYLALPADCVAVVPNAHTPPAFSPRPQRRVMTVGHVVDYKNPSTWITVADAVTAEDPEVEFVWYGDGPLLDQMREEVRVRGLSGRVRFAGFHAAIQEAYAEALLYFHPSRKESCGIAVLDALASGVVCISSNAGALPEAVADGVTGFTREPDDVTGFSECILALLRDSELRARMQRAARIQAESHFSPQRQEEKMLALYARLMTERR